MTTTVRFTSWVQPTACGGLPHDGANTTPGDPGAPPANPPLQLGVYLANTGPEPTKPKLIPAPNPTVRVLGPGDVLGIDSGQIIRRFPAPNSTGAPTTNLACIEFAATDLPWRFSPVTATPDDTDQDRLRPWLVLIAVTADLQVDDTTVPCPTITVPLDQLPDLRQSWAWAHAQLDDAADPGRGRSRLLCPRNLLKSTPMRAVLVPAFLAGVSGGLGKTDDSTVHNPAWGIQPGPVRLPVYDHWTFTTGDNLDFQTLIEQIRPIGPADIPGFGSLPVDVSDPFTTAAAGTPAQIIPVGSVLGPIETTPLDAAQQAALDGCTQAVVTRINTAAANNELGPPVRGRYHADRNQLGPASAGTWLDEANGDPRRRLAAARGAEWVTANQDELMAQSWAQAGQARLAAQRLAVARAAQVVTDSLHLRHVAVLTLDEQITLRAPAAGRLPVSPSASAPSLATILAASAAPSGLGTTTSARMTRRGLLARAATGTALTSKAMTGDMLGSPHVATVAATLDAPSAAVVSSFTVAQRILLGPASPTSAPAIEAIQIHTALTNLLPGNVSAAITPVVVSAGGVHQDAPATAGPGMTVLKVGTSAATALWSSIPAPADAIALRVNSMINTAAGTSAATDSLQPVLPTPQITAPLSLGLKERDPNWLIAGVSHFPDGGATLLRPDPAVLEAAMLGANYALLDEYLWRGFPTDRRGTPIQRFWPDQDDIEPIDQWGSSALGTHPTAAPATSTPADLTVLLIRSLLFERYPDTVVAAVPAVIAAGVPSPNLGVEPTPPAFPMIAIDPRTRLVGFPLTSTILQAAPSDAAPGWFFALLEPPTGLRFGVEQWPADAGPFDLLTVSGQSGSGALAEHTLLRRNRLFIHSSRMVEG